MIVETIIQATASLTKIASQDLPGRTAFKVQVLIDSLESYVKNFNKQQTKLLNIYGTEVADKKGTFNITAENINDYNNEIYDILHIEVESFIKVDVDITDKLLLSAEDISKLKPFINFIERD